VRGGGIGGTWIGIGAEGDSKNEMKKGCEEQMKKRIKKCGIYALTFGG
jgi:hypothetical protein